MRESRSGERNPRASAAQRTPDGAASLLDADELYERLKGYGYDSMMQGSSMIQGGALAMAAVSLTPLLGHNGDPVRLVMWGATVTGISAIYVAYIRAAIMEPANGRFGQMSLMLIGIVEMLQFAVLQPDRRPAETYAAWLLIGAAGGLVLIWEAVNRTRRLEDHSYADELASLVQLARSSGWRRVRIISGIVVLLALCGGAILLRDLRGGALIAVSAIPAVIFGLLTLGIHVQIHFERLAMTRVVSEALAARRGPA
jgi:hypothetical protein